MEVIEAKALFKKYSAYKDSGVEWLGQIPSEWRLLANKYVFRLKKNQVGRKSSDFVLLSLTLKGVIRRIIEDGGKFPAEFNTYQEVKKGDFIFCLFDVEETPRCIGLSDFDGMITGAYTVMEVNPTFNNRFLYYFYLNLDLNKRMRPLYTGLRNTISKDNFFSFKTFVPPLPEQTAIANFLDVKTTKIDRAIAQKQKLIALLKERKQIIIQNAVTKGLDPNVKMKDSGVEWIGEIPEGWRVKKIKYVAGNFMYGTSEDCNELSAGTPVLRIPNIGDLIVNYKELKYALLSKEETNKYLLTENDILIVRTNGNPALVGKSALYTATEDHMFASYLIKVRPKKNVFPLFLILALNSFSVRGSLSHSARTSAGNYNLNTQSLGDCYLAYPTIDEQIQITKFINIISSKLEKSILSQVNQIGKLKEYKATLIDSAVTGKIKVTEV